MKNYLKLISLAIAVTICIGFSACSASKNDEQNTESTSIAQATESTTNENSTSNIAESSTIEDITSETTESTTAKKKTTTTKKSSVKDKGSDYDTSISLNEALNVLTDFYGSTYNVNATIEEDGWQYFAVYDKKGTKYASVKVKLSTAEAVETIIDTGEKNEYNLLA
ncbi:MAG: hypothetical protein ACLUFN_00580 [Eubacterium sp.]